jgi:Uma2 family endonuclease
MAGVRKKATYRDLVAVREPLVAEIIAGELSTSPRPAVPHTLAASAIGSILFDRFNRPTDGPESPGGWWILYEPELHLGEDVLVPDLAGWRRERMPSCPKTAAITMPPDWACEVVSPSTGALDRVRKLPIYAREQVGHLWMVDPVVHTLEVYRLEDTRWVVAGAYGGSGTVRADPFADVALDTARWWGEE